MSAPSFLLRRPWLLGLLLLACLGGCGRHEAAGGKLVIGTDGTYPPLESLAPDGKFVGFDVDLGNAIGRELGRKVEWVNSAFDGIFPALLGRKFDLVISSVTITEDRRKSLAFSDPYYTAGQLLAIRKDGPSYGGLADLRGKRVGIQLNTTAWEVLKSHPEIEVQRFNSIDLALLALQNGSLDAAMGDGPPLLHYMNSGSFNGLKPAGSLLTEEHYGIVMRPDDRSLQLAVNRALHHLQETGEFARLEKKWFGATTQRERQPGTWDLLRVVAPSLAKAAITTVELTLLALLFGLPLGLLVALGRVTRFPLARGLATLYVEVLRGTPLLVQIFAIYYVLPAVGLRFAQWPAAVLALSINCAAYIAEIFRAGIESIDRGQMEAARSLGMTYGMAMQKVILPQTFRRVLPPLTNEAIALLKDSSLVSVIAMVELTREGQQLTSQVAAPMLIWPLVGLYYLILTLPLTRLAGYLERRWTISSH